MVPSKCSEMIPLCDMTFNNRLGMMMGTNSLKRQQSSLDSEPPTVTDQTVSKISTMFPTVTETHIRTLLLKYLKNVFPVVEETILLDTLSSSDNNVHHATQTLVTMGFDKKMMSSPRVCLQKPNTDRGTVELPTSTPVVQSPSHRMLSVDEKLDLKMRLKRKHSCIPDRVVSIALDSVDFDETRADQILNMMADEKHVNNCKQSAPSSNNMQEGVDDIIIEEPPQLESTTSPPIIFCNKDKFTNIKSKHSYQASHSKLAVGPNPDLPKGPNQALLLLSHRPDYVAWVGSHMELANGPNASLRRGVNPALCLGPNHNLAKGSMYNNCQRSYYS